MGETGDAGTELVGVGGWLDQVGGRRGIHHRVIIAGDGISFRDNGLSVRSISISRTGIGGDGRDETQGAIGFHPLLDKTTGEGEGADRGRKDGIAVDDEGSVAVFNKGGAHGRRRLDLAENCTEGLHITAKRVLENIQCGHNTTFQSRSQTLTDGAGVRPG